MESIRSVVEENTASTEEMAGRARRVMDAVQNIAAISGEQTTSTEEVSASTDHVNTKVKQMSAQAQELAVTAEQRRNLLDDRAAGPAAIVPLRPAA
jgi:methyl-accepting chemotaxis protein